MKFTNKILSIIFSLFLSISYLAIDTTAIYSEESDLEEDAVESNDNFPFIFTIPSELLLDKDGKGTVEASVRYINGGYDDDLKMSMKSKNNLRLINDEGIELAYKFLNLSNETNEGVYEFLPTDVDDASSYIKAAFNISLYVDEPIAYSGTYKDTLTFSFNLSPIKYNVVFHTKGEEEITNQYIVENNIILPDVENEGYEFEGWYVDQEYKYPIPSSNMIDLISYANTDKEIHIYAKWEEISTDDIPIVEEETPIEEVVEEIKEEEEPTEQEIVEEEKKEEDVLLQLLEDKDIST